MGRYAGGRIFNVGTLPGVAERKKEHLDSHIRTKIVYRKMTDYGSTFKVIVSKKELIFANN